MSLKEECTDKRGTVWSFKISNDPLKEFLIQFTKKGYYRGGDIHPGKQYNILIEGEGIMFKKINGIDYPINMKKGDMIIISKGIPHIFYSTTDSWMIEFHEYPGVREIYPPYRNQIKK